METQNKPYDGLKGPYYIVPKKPNWDDDLWYYDVFGPKYLLNKLKLSYENSKEKK